MLPLIKYAQQKIEEKNALFLPNYFDFNAEYEMSFI